MATRNGEQAEKGTTPKRGTTPADVRYAQRILLIIDMRKAGASYRSIAAHLTEKGLPLSPSQVHRDVAKALAEANKREHLKIKHLRQLENERLDAAQLAVWPAVLRGDIGASWLFLGISNARARLNGLNAPVEVQVDARAALAALLGVAPDQLPPPRRRREARDGQA